MKKQTIVDIIVLLFVLLFMYAAVSKLLDFDRFRTQIGVTPLLKPLEWWIAVTVPVIEILLSLLLVVPRWQLLALYGSTILMLVFTLYIIGILKFSNGAPVPCSCGGLLQQMSWDTHIFFNSIFVGLGLTAIWICKQIRNGVNGRQSEVAYV